MKTTIADIFAPISEMVSRFNSHPLYLQVLGEELCRAANDPLLGEITPALYTTVAQETLLGQGCCPGYHTLGQVALGLRRSSNSEMQRMHDWAGRLG